MFGEVALRMCARGTNYYTAQCQGLTPQQEEWVRGVLGVYGVPRTDDAMFNQWCVSRAAGIGYMIRRATWDTVIWQDTFLDALAYLAADYRRSSIYKARIPGFDKEG